VFARSAQFSGRPELAVARRPTNTATDPRCLLQTQVQHPSISMLTRATAAVLPGDDAVNLLTIFTPTGRCSNLIIARGNEISAAKAHVIENNPLCSKFMCPQICDVTPIVESGMD
jgi:hypothetical protein